MSDHAAALALQIQHGASAAEQLRRAGWKVGAHALQPMRHQRRQVHTQQRQRRPGILGRLLSR